MEGRVMAFLGCDWRSHRFECGNFRGRGNTKCSSARAAPYSVSRIDRLVPNRLEHWHGPYTDLTRIQHPEIKIVRPIQMVGMIAPQ